jgi:hypothetical protein
MEVCAAMGHKKPHLCVCCDLVLDSNSLLTVSDEVEQFDLQLKTEYLSDLASSTATLATQSASSVSALPSPHAKSSSPSSTSTQLKTQAPHCLHSRRTRL